MAARVAVINDDTVFLDLMHDLLPQEGYITACYTEGANAYRQVREFKPDAIILDIRMESPTTGWEVLALLKLDPVLGTKPIIICSADVRQLQERGPYLQSKGCLIIAKPFGLNDMLGMLKQALGTPHTSDPA